MNNQLNTAKQLFFNHFKEWKNLPYKIKKINQGFTNSTYLIKINKQKYQIRIGDNNNIVDRVNEFNTLNNLKHSLYVFYDVNNGNSIKKWIEVNNLKHKIISYKIINLINQEILLLHKTKIENEILEFNPFVFYELSKNKLDIKYLELYTELINKNKHLTKVLSHNDISLVNIIYHKNKVYLIDFEWTRLNNYYWDYANFIREADLSLKKIKYWTKINNSLELKTLIEFLYLTTCYAMQWTYATSENKKLIKYRKKTFKKLIKYHQYLELNSNE
ncbi:MAG: phosphotransferase [Ureaplasma sp.]|nr:phosphotransferase [Ureaplasma sp.]